MHGVLLLDKPSGITTNRALQRVQRLLGAAKAGHTGSLDPLATGMLPICLGEATKLTGLMLGADKTYQVAVKLGQATDTADSTGSVVAEAAVPALSQALVGESLLRLTGRIEQVPPMYSALKHEGQRLYALARRGVEVERVARTVTIHELTLLRHGMETLELHVRCSKGTYVRTLAEDLARLLGTVGHVTALRRLAVEPFGRYRMTKLEELEQAADADACLLPVDSVIADWPRLSLDASLVERLIHGQAVRAEADWPRGRVRLHTAAGGLFGIGEVGAGDLLIPRRMFPGLGPWS
ncbi:MAG TPA: tRNA pseudouridine(55) synthase TruB [Gammaproteobacteria bacterium]|nr:tRNA pseudouridine(55) synthase TruB [Gammaproteobacteria bacterium]